jgi:spore coat protein U-like protein
MAASCAMLASAPALNAATDTTTFTVSASIVDSCDVQATNLAFGTYSPSSSTAHNGTSTISVYCTVGTGYSLGLDVGTGGGVYTARKMTAGGSQLLYNLYTSAARTTVWGDGTASTGTVSGSGAGLLSAVSHTVYGQIGINQDSAPGTYTSTITVTLTF